ncbi:Breast and ovarian cancer susceptibility 1 [Trichuris trichiura]|uniref:Breast and ovarian cancer susceptibility 1 n=1 Tax=Trichuris trichiura TaxID=36087 RepID=A0A077ZGK6_TRITR|nr:Breast and ovarian cancer susceptibility 1 [Trichuris trichiura]
MLVTNEAAEGTVNSRFKAIQYSQMIADVLKPIASCQSVQGDTKKRWKISAKQSTGSRKEKNSSQQQQTHSRYLDVKEGTKMVTRQIHSPA